MRVIGKHSLIGLFILFCLPSCENYEEKYNYALEENRNLENRIEELEVEMETIQADIDEKTQQIEELENENENLKNILEEAGVEY